MRIYADFPPEVWKTIEVATSKALSEQKAAVAAFDADGTLWDTDLGENFFKYKIRNKLVEFGVADPWRHYRDWKESGDPRPAYLWLAQVCRGVDLDQVKRWASDAVAEFKPLPVFEAQRKLLDYLLGRGVKVYVVTASVKWAVEPGARLLGLQNEDVLGVETAVEAGKVTDKPAGFMTYREGKASALLETTKGQKPFLVSGNTKGDFALLESSSAVRLAVISSHPGEEMHPSESELQAEAARRGWITHRFR